jgi:hypothetical protein
VFGVSSRMRSDTYAKMWTKWGCGWTDTGSAAMPSL